MYSFRTFAHSLRRKYIDEYLKYGEKDMYYLKMREVIWACQNCHSKLDANEHSVTYDIVRNTIAKRHTPVE